MLSSTSTRGRLSETNMGMTEEILLIYLLEEEAGLQTAAEDVAGEFFSLLVLMRKINDKRHLQCF